MKAGAIEFLTKPFRDQTSWMLFALPWIGIVTGGNRRGSRGIQTGSTR